MGREVRKVPANWQHPMDERTGNHTPLMEGQDYAWRKKDWEETVAEKGLQEAIEWCGNPPNINDFMPNWPESERTHYMMYEDTSEGTPISPAFATPEELARWLADTGASSFGSDTASYESWLRVANGGFACSAIVIGGVMQNGVDGLTEAK